MQLKSTSPDYGFKSKPSYFVISPSNRNGFLNAIQFYTTIIKSSKVATVEMFYDGVRIMTLYMFARKLDTITLDFPNRTNCTTTAHILTVEEW